MVDREERDALIVEIRRYSSDQITAFEFDQALWKIRSRTTDETVQFVAQALWLFYDDVRDHKIVADKAVWDLFQRMLLLLHSDAELVFFLRREWTVRQPLASFALAGFVWAAFRLGFGYPLLALVVPFGLFSILLARWRRWSDAARDTDWRRFPFSSLAEIRAVRRRCPRFQKQHYPEHLEQRKIRTWTSGRVLAMPTYAAWVLLAPLVLIFQMLPEKERDRKIVSPR
jgi:hypothetical protein